MFGNNGKTNNMSKSKKKNSQQWGSLTYSNKQMAGVFPHLCSSLNLETEKMRNRKLVKYLDLMKF